MQDIFRTFLDQNARDIARDDAGELVRNTSAFAPIASEKIARSMLDGGIADSPEIEPQATLHERLAAWVLKAGDEERQRADLAISMPPASVHFVAGQFNIFYDFKNTDITLHELTEAGAAIRGTLLDFGCSSGRNLAVLKRAYGDALDLFGADPAGPSITWLKENVAGVDAVVSSQNPPLPYADGMFDLIIAKSIWTHFSPRAARWWFEEMARIMKPGGHFMFSTHGQHDIASRILHDIPLPRYERFAGHDNWTRDLFLEDTVRRMTSQGHYFQPYKEAGHQADLKLIENTDTSDWGLMFMTERYLRDTLLPPGLEVVRRGIARTGNRHDVYIVRKR